MAEILKAMTMRQWADFTGWWVVKTGIGSYWAVNSPVSIVSGGWRVLDGGAPQMRIPECLVVPFTGDWEKSLHEPETICPDCKGSGNNRYNRGGFILCQKCGGSGRVTLHGHRKIKEFRDLEEANDVKS